MDTFNRVRVRGLTRSARRIVSAVDQAGRSKRWRKSPAIMLRVVRGMR